MHSFIETTSYITGTNKGAIMFRKSLVRVATFVFLTSCASAPPANPETKAEHKKIVGAIKAAANELGYGNQFESDDYWEVINTSQFKTS